MTALTISNVVLWILQIATIIVVVGLARQVGLLHLRLPPQGAGGIEDGPQVGAQLELPPTESLSGNELPILVPGHLSVVMLASPSCGACGPTMDAVRRLRDAEPQVHFVVAVDGDPGQGLKYTADYGITDALACASLGHLNSNARPFATILSDDGTVLAAGVPNTLEQLEMLLGLARQTHSSGAVSDRLNLASHVAGTDTPGSNTDLALTASADDLERSHPNA
jgi:methylamine dehydrogenase accessory protein MauD